MDDFATNQELMLFCSMMQENCHAIMHHTRFVALSLIIFVVAAVGGSSETQVSFCDLVKNSQIYNGKVVTVRATYKYGYEWQYLYCLTCLDRGKVWLEIPSDLDDASVKALKRTPKGAGTVNLTVQGVFMSGGTYGHLNGYQYQFVAHKVSNVAIVIKGMKSLDEEKKADQQSACGGANPK
jgi:hypothetical protein